MGDLNWPPELRALILSLICLLAPGGWEGCSFLFPLWDPLIGQFSGELWTASSFLYLRLWTQSPEQEEGQDLCLRVCRK